MMRKRVEPAFWLLKDRIFDAEDGERGGTRTLARCLVDVGLEERRVRRACSTHVVEYLVTE